MNLLDTLGDYLKPRAQRRKEKYERNHTKGRSIKRLARKIAAIKKRKKTQKANKKGTK